MTFLFVFALIDFASAEDIYKSIRISVVITLGYMKAKAAAAVPAIKRVLQDKDEEARWRCLYALEDIGGEAAVDVIIDAYKDEDYRTRLMARKVLRNIGVKRAIPFLLTVLGDENERDLVRVCAATGLCKLGEAKGFEFLVRALESGRKDFRRSAWRALKKVSKNKKN